MPFNLKKSPLQDLFGSKRRQAKKFFNLIGGSNSNWVGYKLATHRNLRDKSLLLYNSPFFTPHFTCKKFSFRSLAIIVPSTSKSNLIITSRQVDTQGVQRGIKPSMVIETKNPPVIAILINISVVSSQIDFLSGSAGLEWTL